MALVIGADVALPVAAVDSQPDNTHGLDVFRDLPKTLRYSSAVCRCQDDGFQDERGMPICGLVALNCARLAYKLWGEGLRDYEFLRQLLSDNTVNDMLRMADVLKSDMPLDFQTSLMIPIFEETISIDWRGLLNDDFKAVLTLWLTEPSTDLAVMILHRASETITGLRIPVNGSVMYAVFDPHPLTDQSPPSGPAFTLSRQFEENATLQSYTGLAWTGQVSAHLLRAQPGGFAKDIESLFLTSAAYLAFSQSRGQSSSAKVDDPQPEIVTCEAPKPTTSDEPNDEVGKPPGLDLASVAGPSIATNIAAASYKQKQRYNPPYYSGSHNKENVPPSLPWSIGRGSNEDLTPYSSTDNLVKPFHLGRPSLAPRFWQDIPHAGPSNLSISTSKLKPLLLHRVSASEPAPVVYTGIHDSTPSKLYAQDDWEVALLRQLQEEEEIAASVAHHVSGENAWLVALQKRVLEEEKRHRITSSSSTSIEADWQLAVQLQQEEVEPAHPWKKHVKNHSIDSDTIPPAHGDVFNEISIVITPPSGPVFDSEPASECGICGERQERNSKIALVVCGHTYCRECLSTFVKTKIDDNRFPIFCPDCLIDRSRSNKCHITPEILDQLDLSQRDLDRLSDIQLLAHSVILECPRCNERINIQRDEYGGLKIIVCSRSECGHRWCKNCLKELASSENKHRCKNENIDRLMRRRGWKYCPGCRTPVQKESGCNHMTCGAPGCNVHFCYKCGVLIVDTTNGGDVGLTVTEHYENSKCKLFERRYNCTIM